MNVKPVIGFKVKVTSYVGEIASHIRKKKTLNQG